MDFTIEFTSGGNHGHQLKDALGGLTIRRLFNLNYVHTPYSYLDYFGNFIILGGRGLAAPRPATTCGFLLRI